MSSEQKNDFFSEGVLVLLIVGAVLAFIGYLLVRFWPYFLFYILPFVLGSLVAGGLMRVVTIANNENEIKENQYGIFQGYIPMHDYRRLAFLYPLLIMAVLGVFYLDSSRKVIVDSRGAPHSIVVEWPKVNELFNKVKHATYADSWFSSLREKAQEFETYDRHDLGNIAWWVLFLGGPAFFFFLIHGEDEEEEQSINAQIKKKIDDALKRERDRLKQLTEKQEEVISKRTENFRKEIESLKAEKEAFLKENLILKAKVEFAPGRPRQHDPVAATASGILDEDIL